MNYPGLRVGNLLSWRRSVLCPTSRDLPSSAAASARWRRGKPQPPCSAPGRRDLESKSWRGEYSAAQRANQGIRSQVAERRMEHGTHADGTAAWRREMGAGEGRKVSPASGCWAGIGTRGAGGLAPGLGLGDDRLQWMPTRLATPVAARRCGLPPPPPSSPSRRRAAPAPAPARNRREA